MAKNAHLTLDERLTIQSSLADRLSFKAIGLIIGKDPSTIAKEVKGHLKIEEKGIRTYNASHRLYPHGGERDGPEGIAVHNGAL